MRPNPAVGDPSLFGAIVGPRLWLAHLCLYVIYIRFLSLDLYLFFPIVFWVQLTCPIRMSHTHPVNVKWIKGLWKRPNSEKERAL